MAKRIQTDEVCVCGHLKSQHDPSPRSVCQKDGCLCNLYLMKRPFYGKVQPFGWDVEMLIEPLHEKATRVFHYRGCSIKAAQRKAMAATKRDVKGVHVSCAILRTTELTRAQWISAYGLGRM